VIDSIGDPLILGRDLPRNININYISENQFDIPIRILTYQCISIQLGFSVRSSCEIFV
jgi:hypothetical protein